MTLWTRMFIGLKSRWASIALRWEVARALARFVRASWRRHGTLRGVNYDLREKARLLKVEKAWLDQQVDDMNARLAAKRRREGSRWN